VPAPALLAALAATGNGTRRPVRLAHYTRKSLAATDVWGVRKDAEWRAQGRLIERLVAVPTRSGRRLRVERILRFDPARPLRRPTVKTLHRHFTLLTRSQARRLHRYLYAQEPTR